MGIPLVTRTALVALAVLVNAGFVQASGNHPLLRTALVGAWEVTITPVNCETGERYSDFAFLSFLTFAAGGTMSETSSSLSFQPNQRSPGTGFWDYTGRGTYRGFVKAFVRFDSVDPMPPARPYQKGTQSIDQSIRLTDRNHWISDAVVNFRNVSGEIVPPTGCAAAAAERMR